jgi:hypothetical protein
VFRTKEEGHAVGRVVETVATSRAKNGIEGGTRTAITGVAYAARVGRERPTDRPDVSSEVWKRVRAVEKTKKKL